MLMAVKFTAVLAAQWKLAYNIHPDDGHDFGYNQEAWEDETNVGSVNSAFQADYKRDDVTRETANFIAIVRHQNGVCDAARVWEFEIRGKSLSYYLSPSESSWNRATSDEYIYDYNDYTSKFKDCIFSVDGGLVFNWLYKDNGVRIGVSGNYRGSGVLPEDPDDDTFVGLGNSFDIDDARGYSHWRHDVGVYKTYNYKSSQGKDHGSRMVDGEMVGQYAIFISDAATRFPCTVEYKELQVEMIEIAPTLAPTLPPTLAPTLPPTLAPTVPPTLSPTLLPTLSPTLSPTLLPTLAPTLSPTVAPTSPTMAPSPFPYRQFAFIDLNLDGFLDFAETAFDIADINKDGSLSFQEFNATLQVVHVKGE